MITTERKTIISPRTVQSASSVRIPQNIGTSLLTTINITPLKLSSVSSIRLNNASTWPGRCVVSLSKRHLLPKSTGNTQE